MISENQKQIYNSFLYTSRKVKDKPCRLRQDFSSIDTTTELVLKKLDILFSRYQHIKYNDFFIAPYMVHSKEEYYDLSFFKTQRAIKCYSLYMAQKELADPDNENTITDCKQGCSFIYNFCKENSLTLSQYKTHTTGSVPIILQHLKDHKINFYVLQGLEVHKLLQTTEPQIVNFVINDFFKIYTETKNNFIKSNKLKPVIRAAFKIIEEKLLQLTQITL